MLLTGILSNEDCAEKSIYQFFLQPGFQGFEKSLQRSFFLLIHIGFWEILYGDNPQSQITDKA